MNKLLPVLGIGSANEDEFKEFIKEKNEDRVFKGDEPLTKEKENTALRDKFYLDNQFQFYIDNGKVIRYGWYSSNKND